MALMKKLVVIYRIKDKDKQSGFGGQGMLKQQVCSSLEHLINFVARKHPL